MIEIALRRGFSEVVASPRVTTGEQGKIDRGWQDKSRKVRTVGWVRNSARSGLFGNIASLSRNLHFSTTRYRRSTIDTLRNDR